MNRGEEKEQLQVLNALDYLCFTVAKDVTDNDSVSDLNRLMD